MDSKLYKILQEATSIYKRYGIKSVSMEDLCKEMKISKKTLYKYVNNKEELISKIFLEYLNQEFEKHIQSLKSNKINAVDFIMIITKHYNYENNAITTAMVNDLYLHFPLIFKQFSSLNFQRKQEIISMNLVQGQNEGLYKHELKIDIITHIFSNLELFSKIPDEARFSDNDAFNEIIRIYIYSVGTPKGISHYESLILEHV